MAELSKHGKYTLNIKIDLFSIFKFKLKTRHDGFALIILTNLETDLCHRKLTPPIGLPLRKPLERALSTPETGKELNSS